MEPVVTCAGSIVAVAAILAASSEPTRNLFIYVSPEVKNSTCEPTKQR
jgi:hypothetical protein